MTRCSKCGRGHGGICGIPAGVTLGYGARRSGIAANKPISTTRARATRKSSRVLEEVLSAGREQYKKVVDMLKQSDPAMSEYADLLYREGKLAAIISQVQGQIAERR